jgi:hypothetical protein
MSDDSWARSTVNGVEGMAGSIAGALAMAFAPEATKMIGFFLALAIGVAALAFSLAISGVILAGFAVFAAFVFSFLFILETECFLADRFLPILRPGLFRFLIHPAIAIALVLFGLSAVSSGSYWQMGALLPLGFAWIGSVRQLRPFKLPFVSAPFGYCMFQEKRNQATLTAKLVAMKAPREHMLWSVYQIYGGLLRWQGWGAVAAGLYYFPQYSRWIETTGLPYLQHLI